MGDLARHYDLALDEEITELVGTGFGPLLKFDANTCKFSSGDNEVAIGREYIAHVNQYARGWSKFADKKPVQIKIKKLTEGDPEERNELDDAHMAGRDDDPWVFQRYLPMEDVETGEAVVFVSKSVGGKIALGNLLQAYKGGRHRGLPIVKLGIGSFRTQDYGKKPRPDFAIIGWVGGNGAGMQKGGPPESDPEDPGYDPSYYSR
jgi:hypothetical protein